MPFEKAICFLPTSYYMYTFHNPVQSHHSNPLLYTHTRRYPLVVVLSVTYTLSTRGARAGQPQSAWAVLCRWFSASRAFRAFRCALCVLDTPEHGERPTVALPARSHEDHEEVPVAV